MNQTIPMFRNRFLNEKLEEVKRWKEEGKSKEEVLRMIDRKILTDEDVEKIYKEDSLENHTVEENNNLEDSFENQNENETVEEKNEEEEIEVPIESTGSLEEESIENEDIKDNDTEENNNIFNLEEKDFDKKADEVFDNIEPKELKDKLIQNGLELTEEYKSIPDEDLVDFEDQPFKLYNDEKKEEMIRSIKLNGIIQPLIVRPIGVGEGKYQILSGHNRRICGREAGLKVFPCKIKYDLTDDEARLYLVDSNLATRNEISPMERARALLIRKNTYRNEKIKSKIESSIEAENRDNNDISKRIQEIENMSSGNLQRYLRLNYLDKGLQELVDNGKVSLKVAENLSYLPKDKQRVVGNLIEKENIKVSESQAVKLKKEDDLNKEKIVEMLSKKTKEDNTTITIKFEKEELQNFFSEEDFNDLNTIKNAIINALEAQKNI